MDKEQLSALAQKYINGTATPEEKRLLDLWYDNMPTEWPETVNLKTGENGPGVQEEMLTNLRNQLFTEQSAPKQSALIKHLSVWIGSAAAVLLIGFLAWHWYQSPNNPATAYSVEQTVKVPSYQVMHLTLPDGSKVWLNKGSVFHYPKSFDGKTRVVELVEGRAFFDIRHDSAHPFVVKTKSANITVLGTSFDVSSYDKTGLTKVSVVTGKVGVTCTDPKCNGTLFLLPKQQVVLNRNSVDLIRKPETQPDINGWCKNYYVFDQERLENVFKVLEKEYHANISVSDKKLLDERVSLPLNNQHLDSIMKVLSFIHPFKYQMANDSTVIIK